MKSPILGQCDNAQSGTRQIAFVDHGGGYFEPRDIEVGARAGDDFVALKGLKAGERIATSANFLIDSESQLQAALGSFAPPPPGVGAAAAMNATQAATLEYSSNPSTPRAGSNNFRVKLANPPLDTVRLDIRKVLTVHTRRALVGAALGIGMRLRRRGGNHGRSGIVTFFMPAMPAMGMAAMRMRAHNSHFNATYNLKARIRVQLRDSMTKFCCNTEITMATNMTRPLANLRRVKFPAADDAPWAAVVARDRAVDGKFYYSVATTGVYCRPSCPLVWPSGQM